MSDLSFEDQFLLAVVEGPVVLSISGDRLRGFADLSAAMAYLDADRARRGIEEPVKKVLLIGGSTNGGSDDGRSI